MTGGLLTASTAWLLRVFRDDIDRRAEEIRGGGCKRAHNGKQEGRREAASITPMYYTRPGTVNWTTISTAVGFGIGFILTICVVTLLYRTLPQMRRPAVFFWVMLATLIVTCVGGIALCTHLQFQNRN